MMQPFVPGCARQLHGHCRVAQCTARWLKQRMQSRTYHAVSMEHRQQSTAAEEVGGVERPKGLKKRPVALHVGYVGTNYRGLQASAADDMAMRLQTVEGLLERAILQAGLMLPSNYGHLHKVKWRHASRTDKGVHSLYTVVTLNMLVDEALMLADSEGIHYSQLINHHLPHDIRVFSIQRINPSFDPRRYCQQRRYTYFLPVSVLGMTDGKSREDAEKLERFRKALEEYKGTKPFHNYAGRRKQYRKDDKRNSGRGPPSGSRQKTEQTATAFDETALSEDDTEDDTDDEDTQHHKNSHAAGNKQTQTNNAKLQTEGNNANKQTQESDEPKRKTLGATHGDSVADATNQQTGTGEHNERMRVEPRQPHASRAISTDNHSAGGSDVKGDVKGNVGTEQDGEPASKSNVHPATWGLPVVFGCVAWLVAGPLAAVGVAGCVGFLGFVGHRLGLLGHVSLALSRPWKWVRELVGGKPQAAAGVEAGRQLRGDVDPWLMSVKFNETVDESDRVVRSHFRTINDIGCSDVMRLTPDGIPCVKVDIVGSSFMLHQIRHMVGAAAAVTTGVLPWELFQLSLTVPTRVAVPRSPPHTLMLDGAVFGDFYKPGSEKSEQLLATTGERLELREQGQKHRGTFNQQVLYPAMDELLHDPVWISWSGILSRHVYNPTETQQALELYSQWRKPRPETAQQLQRTSAPQPSNGGDDKGPQALGGAALSDEKTATGHGSEQVPPGQVVVGDQGGAVDGSISTRRPSPQGPEDSQKKKPKPKMRVPPEVELYCRADMVVGQIVSVQAVEASEKLLACQVDCGRGDIRQAAAALRSLVKAEDLQGQRVVAISNVRPAKLAGQLSNCVVLVGWQYRRDGTKAVSLVQPPDGAAIGDSVYLSGHQRRCQAIAPAYRVNPSTWDRFQNSLGAQEDGVVTFKGLQLVTASGEPISVRRQGEEKSGGGKHATGEDGGATGIAATSWVVEGA